MKGILSFAVCIPLFCGCDDEPKETEEVDTDTETDDGLDPAAHTVCPFESEAEPEGANWVNGELVEFNDNGGWCWYQDERVIVDSEAERLVIGSVAYGGDRDKQVEATHLDLSTEQTERYVLGTVSYTDDHDAPAFIQRPDGGYAAMWAGHNDDCMSYHSVFDGDAWADAERFTWPSENCPTPGGETVTYSNMWYMGDAIFSFVRSVETSPNYIYSTDDGLSYTLGGRLTSTTKSADDYVAGYYKYWGNNVDRIDWLGTEGHPRTVDNSLWHGYLEKKGDAVKIYNSHGEAIDEDGTDDAALDISSYTQVFKTGATVNGQKMAHLWNADLVRYGDGAIAAIGSARVLGSIGQGDPEKRLLYFRFDGSEWKTTYLAKAGAKLYEQEEDYTGLGALDPDNPHIIYISTPFDPRTDEGDYDGKKEIWKGVTCDDGETFDWEPVTANSDVDNLRPVVPKWNARETALLWLRGTYLAAQEYDLKIVGIFDNLSE